MFVLRKIDFLWPKAGFQNLSLIPAAGGSTCRSSQIHNHHCKICWHGNSSRVLWISIWKDTLLYDKYLLLFWSTFLNIAYELYTLCVLPLIIERLLPWVPHYLHMLHNQVKSFNLSFHYLINTPLLCTYSVLRTEGGLLFTYIKALSK